MKSVEFAYWLQGYFELAEPDELRFETIVCIKSHLALVFIHEGRKASGFCHWLDGVFHDVPMEAPEPTVGEFWEIFPFATAPVKARLSEEFVHVIDPTYPQKQQAALNAVHTSGTKPTWPPGHSDSANPPWKQGDPFINPHGDDEDDYKARC